ncbi:MAG: ABC transporter ATP-binding protein [Geminicoccaceae bacterium]
MRPLYASHGIVLRHPVNIGGWRGRSTGGRSLYGFVWAATGREQIILCTLSLAVIGLSLVPLDLQRRMVNDAIGAQDRTWLLKLAVAYLMVLLIQGGVKLVLNLHRGRVVEEVAKSLRRHILDVRRERAVHEGTLVSMVAAEAEDVAGFVAESVATPFLQGGTVVATLGYLLWVQPLLALLAMVLYAPALVVVPWRQHRINRLGRVHTRVVRRLGDHLVLDPDRQGSPEALSTLVQRAFDSRLAIYRIKYFLTFLGNFLDALGPLGVLAIGGRLVMDGRTTVGALMVFITGFQKVGDPLDQLLTFYRTAQNARVTYGLIVDAVGLPGERGAGR